MDRVTRKWIRSEADEKAAAAGCKFDLAAADQVRQFFPKFLRHSKGPFAGKPFELQDWQWLHLVGPLHGWKRADGRRRFTVASCWVPKKNGKSTLAAGEVLWGLVGEVLTGQDAGAEVFGGASDRQQASLIFNECAAMVLQSPELRKILRVVDTTKRIAFPPTSSYRVLSKEAKKTGHGINASMVVLDELHLLDREMYDTLRYAGAARAQPLFIEISTAGRDLTSFGYERYQYAKQVQEGLIEDPELLVYIAEADGNDVWAKPAQWQKANPSWGVTIDPERFRADFETAKRGSPGDRAAFCQLRLNIWQEQQAEPWIEVEKWDACKGWESTPVAKGDATVAKIETLASLNLTHLLGRKCYAGGDLSSTTDLCALALLFPDCGPKEDIFDLLAWFWVPENGCKKRERLNKVRFDNWIAQGWIQQVEGDVIDFGLVRQKLQWAGTLFQIERVVFDEWNALQLLLELRNDGFQTEKFRQNMSFYTGPMKEMEKLILAGRIRHGGNPVLRWNVGNVLVRRDDADNVMPSKRKSREKIDGLCAALMALAPCQIRDAQGTPTITVL